MKWITLTDKSAGKHYCNAEFIKKVWVNTNGVTCISGLGNNGWGEYKESYDEVIDMINK